MAYKEEKKKNPYVRNGLVQARINPEETAIIVNNAILYTGGDVSKWVRLATLNYKPPRKAGK